MNFKSLSRAFRRGHLVRLPIEKPNKGQEIEDVKHAIFRVSKRGKLIPFSS